MGSLSLGTRPKTSEEAQTWITGEPFTVWRTASSNPEVPFMLVAKVASGASKLVRGKLCAARWKM